MNTAISQELASIHTQIGLTPSLYQAAKQYSSLYDISLSELIRRSLQLKLKLEEDRKDRRREKLEKLAKYFVGSGSWDKNHPHWSSPQAVEEWLRDIRSEWDSRGWEDPEVIRTLKTNKQKR